MAGFFDASRTRLIKCVVICQTMSNMAAPETARSRLSCQRSLALADAIAYTFVQGTQSFAMNLDLLYNESLALLEGRGIQKDEHRSFEINRTAAIEGHADATLAMGWFYLNGVGVERSVADAITWYRRSARKGEPRAMFSLGFIAYGQKDWGDALTWFRRAADSGHHRSLFWIGKLYWRGHTAKQSRSEAMRLFHLAAKKRVPDATRALRWLTVLNKIARKAETVE